MTDIDMELLCEQAALNLTAAEKESLRADLAGTLRQLETIAKLELDDTEPTVSVFGGQARLRADLAERSGDSRVLLDNAPAIIGDEVRVPRIVE